MIGTHEIVNRNLHPIQACSLLMAANMAEAGAEVTVCMTVPKVTDAAPRQGNGVDFLSLPGIAPDAQIGPMTVHRYVDNAKNRREERVGQVYFKVRSITRANGLRPFGWTNVRPEQITGFMLLGIVTPTEEQMATRALAEAAAAQAQAPQGA
jgi:hypothetical protein